MFHVLNFVRNYQRNRQYRVMQISSFFLFWAIAFALFEYFAPLYLESLNIDLFTIGIILSGGSLISFFIDPFLGNLQKKFAPKTLLSTAILLFCFTIILFINVKASFWLLFLATNLYGIAFDLASITSYKEVFDNSVEQDRSTNISFFESLYALGLLIGAIIAGFVVSLNLKSAANLAFAILVFLFIIILWTKDKKYKNKKNPLNISYKEIFRELKTIGRSGVFLVFLLIFIHLFDGFFFVFEPIFAKKFTGYFLNETIIGGLLMAIYTLPIIILEPYFGRLEDKFGRKKFIFIGLCITALAIFSLQSFNHVLLSALSVFLVSLGLFAITCPAVEGLYESIIVKKLGKNHISSSVSIMEITLSIGFLFGPLIGGLLLSTPGGFNFAFQIFSLLSFIVLILSFIFLRK